VPTCTSPSARTVVAPRPAHAARAMVHPDTLSAVADPQLAAAVARGRRELRLGERARVGGEPARGVVEVRRAVGERVLRPPVRLRLRGDRGERAERAERARRGRRSPGTASRAA
jgi:hypothetical protein